MEDRQSRNKKEIIGDPINRKEDRLVVLSRRQESRAAAAINRRCPLALIEEHGSSSLGSILARRTFGIESILKMINLESQKRVESQCFEGLAGTQASTSH